MKNEAKQSITNGGKRKFILIIIVVIGLVGGANFYLKNKSSSDDKEAIQEEAPVVTVKSLSELVEGVVIEKAATIEPAVSAPLVARVGGRITAVNMNLGSTVRAGQIVVSVDTGVEANPARAQLAAVRSSLVVLDDIERETLKTAENAIKTAQLSVDAAKTGRQLTASQVAKSKQQASLSLRRAELAFDDATEAEQRIDQVVRAADIGLQAAQIAQEQARIAENQANQQTGDALKRASQGLNSAKQGKDRARVEIQSQRVSLGGQEAAVAEQVRLSQVLSPVAGQVTRLDVKRGDYVRPGQEVGEIIAFKGALIKLDVSTGVRAKLSIGQEVTITAKGQKFTGEIGRLADGPRTDIALWQVDILIDGTPSVIHPGDLVTVKLQVGVVGEDNLFVPLDAVLVRQNGIILMTADENGKISEHSVEPISYSGDYIEATVDLPAEAMVVISGSRTLREGDIVRIES